jgi:outer membrane protein, protease secretion system
MIVNQKIMSLANKPIRRILPVMLMAAISMPGVVHAYGLVQAYQDALVNDAAIRSAKFENDAGIQNKRIGLSGLLPNVSANFSRSKNEAEFTRRDLFGRDDITRPNYNSNSASLTVRQPLLALDGVARFKQGIAQAQSSEALFASRQHELIVRLVATYVDLLFAADQLTLAVAQRDILAEQIRVNERLFAKGEGTRTDVLETQARLDIAEAQLVDARDTQGTARDALSAMVGRSVGVVDGLGGEFRPLPMEPADFEGWKALAMKNNQELQAQTFNVEVARQEVKRNRAGHFPRIDLVASYANSGSESISTVNQDSVIRSIGFQINIPLYAGGGVNASTDQATANFLRSKADYDGRADIVLTDLRRQYNLVVSSVARLEALGKAVESARLLVIATQQSIKGGVRINLDLLNSRAQFYAAQRDLAQARYNYLQSYIRLRAGAGLLNSADLTQLGAYFVATR